MSYTIGKLLNSVNFETATFLTPVTQILISIKNMLTDLEAVQWVGLLLILLKQVLSTELCHSEQELKVGWSRMELCKMEQAQQGSWSHQNSQNIQGWCLMSRMEAP